MCTSDACIYTHVCSIQHLLSYLRRPTAICRLSDIKTRIRVPVSLVTATVHCVVMRSPYALDTRSITLSRRPRYALLANTLRNIVLLVLLGSAI